MATEPDKRRRKGAPVWALELPVALLCLGVWAARPLPPTVRVYTLNGKQHREEFRRAYKVIAPRDRGVGRSQTFGSGPNGGSAVTDYRLGPFAIEDEHSEVWQPLPPPAATVKAVHP